MYHHQTTVRVRYADTDQMGFVYYGRYLEYLEVARTEAMRALDVPYDEMERQGVALPVLEVNIKYFKPGFYDDVIVMDTKIEEMPSGRITFHTSMKKEGHIEINMASVTLCFVDRNSGRPCRPPSHLLKKLAPYFD